MHSAMLSKKSSSLFNNFASLGLGIDMGGTQTRWALSDELGHILTEGATQGATALQLSKEEGQIALQELFFSVAHEINNIIHQYGEIQNIQAGLTGFNGNADTIKKILANAFDLPEESVRISNDIEIAFLDVFQPGEGYLVYAGTGSIAAYIDKSGDFHRAGGHGYVLDDAGSGYWIARKALKHIWREEDMHPGAWHSSPMAKAVFDQIGGHDWNRSRDFIYQSARGDVGLLAMAVASAANDDAVALNILHEAGVELARLGNAMCLRFGQKPIALSGRVQDLHPIIRLSMQQHLPAENQLHLCKNVAHHGAARVAAKQATTLS
jgi:glucosamine kinase